MNQLSRRSRRVNISLVTSLVFATPVARADGPTPSKPRYAAGQVVADWAATPPPAVVGCWKPGSRAGTYQLLNGSVGCTAVLGLSKVVVAIDSNGNVTALGGHAPSGTVHTLDAIGAAANAPFPALATPGTANEAVTKGIIFADDKGVYLPQSIALGGAAPAIGAAKPRVEGGKFIADWTTKPDANCWMATGTPDAKGAGTYALKNASPACTNSLGLTPVDAAISGSGKLTFAGKAQKGNDVYSLDAKGNALPEIGALEEPTFANAHVAAGLLLADLEGVYLAKSVKNKELDVARCRWPKFGDDDSAHVDVDLPRSSVVDVPDRNVVRPNQALMVRVCHVRGEDIAVAWSERAV